MTETARDFITLSMKEAGILGVGQTPLSEDINDCFTLLQGMLAQWQRRRWLVPNLITVSALGNGLESNPIGNGQYYNSPRPDKIQSAYMVQENTGGNPVSLPLRPIFSRENYNLIAIKNLDSLPLYFFYDSQSPIGNVFIWPIPSAIYRIYLTVKAAIGFATGLSEGEITNAGDSYTNGSYVGVPLIGVSSRVFGEDATADITISGGEVTIVTPNNPGNAYVIGDVLTVDNSNVGGTGSGFTYTVTGLEASLDSQTDMPPEYNEAIHYNLTMRICSAYQRQPNKSTIALAKSALNTIRMANTQIPTLVMPPQLVNNGNSFYIFNADG